MEPAGAEDWPGSGSLAQVEYFHVCGGLVNLNCLEIKTKICPQWISVSAERISFMLNLDLKNLLFLQKNQFRAVIII